MGTQGSKECGKTEERGVSGSPVREAQMRLSGEDCYPEDPSKEMPNRLDQVDPHREKNQPRGRNRMARERKHKTADLAV